MGGAHDKGKHQIAIKFPHRLFRQIEKAAAAQKLTVGEYIRNTIKKNIDNIDLTDEDLKIIENRLKEANEKGRMV